MNGKTISAASAIVLALTTSGLCTQASAQSQQPSAATSSSFQSGPLPAVVGLLSKFILIPPNSGSSERQGEPAKPAAARVHRVRHDDGGARQTYAALIAKHAFDHGVPVALADAVVRLESRYNPRAHHGANLGLTQINYRTAQAIGYAGSADGLYDADTNLRFGIKYLAMAYKLAGGDTCRTILKYQSGHRAADMTSAASAYCARVRSVMAEK